MKLQAVVRLSLFMLSNGLSAMQADQVALDLNSWLNLPVPEFQQPACEACYNINDFVSCWGCGNIFPGVLFSQSRDSITCLFCNKIFDLTLFNKSDGSMTCKACNTIFFNTVGSSYGKPLNHPLNNVYGELADLEVINQRRAPKISPIYVDEECYQTVDHYYGRMVFEEAGKKNETDTMRVGWNAGIAWYIDMRVNTISIKKVSLLSRINFIKKGLFAKFTQNKELKDFLLSTGRAYLVFHKQTSLGIFSDAGYKDIPGQNLLGLLLMELRRALRNGTVDISKSKQFRGDNLCDPAPLLSLRKPRFQKGGLNEV